MGVKRTQCGHRTTSANDPKRTSRVHSITPSARTIALITPGDTAEARAPFERAAALDKDAVKARYFIGLAAEQDGRNADRGRERPPGARREYSSVNEHPLEKRGDRPPSAKKNR
jgi:hypothetical protein